MPKHRLVQPRKPQKQTWREILQVLAMVPLVLGALLILITFTGAIVWGTAEQQLLAGALYIFFAFALSNAIQKQWVLALGWLVLSGATWLGITVPDNNARIVVAAMAAVSVGGLAREFMRRRRQFLNSQTH